MSTSVPPTPSSLGYDLLAPDPGIVNPDLTLDAALAPTEDAESDSPRPFGRSWQFDFQAGQFVKDGTVPKVVYELDTLIVWVEKALRTARLAHPIYDDQYGMDDPTLPIGQAAADELLSEYQDSIESALLYHDRIVSVENFTFTQDPFEETLYASFTILIDATAPQEPQAVEFSNVPVGA